MPIAHDKGDRRMPVFRHTYRLMSFIVLLLMLQLPALPLTAADESMPLPTDPAIHIGRLDNGVTYWLRSHATPPGKIALWMHVSTGSVNEADGQEGIAHYLEHMAFNGTDHFPPGELITYFESLGLRFGQHQNAFTSFDQTTYIISLPNTDPETIDKGLLFLADVAFRMRLNQSEIDQERNVILEEKRARKGVGQRLTEKLLPTLLPGSRLAQRLPIGLEGTLKQLQRDDFQDYYSTWYHPSNVTILAVGDAPVDTIAAAVAKHFGSWQRKQPLPIDKPHGITPYTQQRAIVVTDPEVTTASLEMLGISQLTPLRSQADFRRRLVNNLGAWIINQRLHQLVQEGKAPYQSAYLRRSSLFNVAQQFSAEANAEPTAWTAALKGLLIEIQRARQYGFTALELDQAKRATLASAEHAAQTAATREASAFLRSMNRAVAKGERPRSAEQNLQLMQQLLPAISLHDVSQAFHAHYTPEHKAFILTLPEQDDLPVPKPDEILALVNTALSTAVEAWQDTAQPTSLLAQEPQAGDITELDHFAPLDITHVTFANNVRMHYRFMDFKQDHVTVTITLPGGKIRETSNLRGITSLAALALSQPATEQFSSTAIRNFMTGKKVSVAGHMTPDALRLNVSGTPEALEDGLQLVHLLLQDARIEPPSVMLWKQRQLQSLASFQTDIRSRVQVMARLALSNHDARQAVLSSDQVIARANDIPQAQAWLDNMLRQAPMEVAMVGDITQQRALHLAAKYLGSLPKRPRHDHTLAPLRQLAYVSGPLRKTIEVETITPRAYSMLMWRSAAWQEVRGRRLIHLIARILEGRLREEVREKHGLTYSVSVFARPSKIYPSLSALHVAFTADPNHVSEAVRVARSVVEQFAATGPTDEEVNTVRKQLKNSINTMLKRPRFWVNLLSDLEYHGTHLEDVVGLLDQILAFSRSDIAAEAKKVITPERFILVVGNPKAPHQTPLVQVPEPTSVTR
jgi:zinc protease